MRKAFISVVTLVAAALIVVGCKGQKTPDAEDTKSKAAAVSVSVSLVQQRDLNETVDVTGTLKPANEVSVGSRGPGKIVYIVGKSGTRVKKGQVVARLDNTDARIQLRTATAAVRAAQARLEQAKAACVQQKTATDSGIITAQAALSAAKARQQQAGTSANAQKAAADAQVAQATQGLNAAKSRLALLQNGARTQEKQIAENNVRLAEATYNNDTRTYNRYKELFEKGAVAKSTLDTFETKVQLSKTQLDTAKQNADLVKTGPRQEDIDTAKAAVEQAQAVLESARAGLEQVKVAEDNVAIAKTGVEQAEAALKSAQAAINIDTMRDKDVLAAVEGVQQAREMQSTAEQAVENTNITSPVDGVVQEQLTDVGQSVGANVAVLRLTTNSTLFFEAQVSELDASSIRAGQTVLLTIDAMQGSRTNVYGKQQRNAIAGTVERVVPVVDARSRNFTVRVLVPDTAALFPGMFARGEIVTAENPNAVAMPKSALVEKDGSQFVFIAGSDGTARRRQVTLGATDGVYIQAITGVQVGEKVITEGQQALRDGDPVKIMQGSSQS